MKNIPYSRRSINQDDIEAVNEVLLSDWLILFIASTSGGQEGGRNF
jgi:dTDP-4-amino-4,6-dideoxygalactose transaminase